MKAAAVTSAFGIASLSTYGEPAYPERAMLLEMSSYDSAGQPATDAGVNERTLPAAPVVPITPVVPLTVIVAGDPTAMGFGEKLMDENVAGDFAVLTSHVTAY